jgi:hypothetical protein
MRYSRNRGINDKVRELLREGWELIIGGKHLRVRHPNGFSTSFPQTPGDHRSEKNFFAQIKRAERDGFRPLGTITPGAERKVTG